MTYESVNLLDSGLSNPKWAFAYVIMALFIRGSSLSIFDSDIPAIIKSNLQASIRFSTSSLKTGASVVIRNAPLTSSSILTTHVRQRYSNVVTLSHFKYKVATIQCYIYNTDTICS